MLISENMHKVVRIFILAVLCSDMQEILTAQSSGREHFDDYVQSSDGLSATLNQSVKYHVSIRLKHKEKFHLCSGALIAPAVVLTVASCLYNYNENAPHHPAEFQVQLGNLNRYQPNPKTLTYGVTHFYQPETFNVRTFRDNIAIILLDRDIPSDHFLVQPIIWNVGHSSLKFKQPSHNYFRITSWGRSAEGMPIAQLLSFNASMLNETNCMKIYGDIYTKGMHCIIIEPRNLTSCPEDAGAPLLAHNKLVGLASFGYGCASKDYPTLYTNIFHHKEWILAHIGDGTNQNGSLWGSLAFTLFTAYALKKSNIVKI